MASQYWTRKEAESNDCTAGIAPRGGRRKAIGTVESEIGDAVVIQIQGWYRR